MTTAAEKKKLLSQKLTAINKHFKKTVVATADQAVNPYFLRHPTGIMELDVDLAGGFPPGVSMVSGPDGVGKTHLLYRTMAMHQRIYGDKAAIAYAAVEAPIDHFFMRKLGVIIAVPDAVIEEKNAWRKSRGLPSFTKDEVKEMKRQIGTFWDITGATMEQTLQTVIEIVGDEKIRETDSQFGVIGIDSVNALIPNAWNDIELDENGRRAAHASVLTQFFAQLYPLLTRLDGDPMYTSIIFTQQVRANAAKANAPSHIAKYLSDYAPATGAYAAKHGKLIDILLYTGQKVKEKGERDSKATAKKETIQKTLGWELIKGKAGTHEGKTGEVVFEFGTHDFIDLQRTIMVSGIRHGVLLEKGGLITAIDTKTGEDREDVKNIPAQAFIDKMKAEPAFEMEMRMDVLASAGIECRYA